MFKTITSDDRDDFYRVINALKGDGFEPVSINEISAYGEARYVATMHKQIAARHFSPEQIEFELSRLALMRRQHGVGQ